MSWGILLMVDEVLTCMGRTGKMFCVDHWNVVPDIMTLGKGFGNGFPVTAVGLFGQAQGKDERNQSLFQLWGQSHGLRGCLGVRGDRPGGRHARTRRGVGSFRPGQAKGIKERHPIVGDVRGIGCLLGMELVKDRQTREPFEKAANMGLSEGVREGSFLDSRQADLRMSPPLIMSKEVAGKAVDLIEEAIAETERELACL